MKITAATSDGRACHVTWSDGSATEFPLIYLRDNDPNDLHPDTQERTFDLSSVALDIQPRTLDTTAAAVLLRWPDKSSESIYSGEWLYAHRPGVAREDPAGVTRTCWDAKAMPQIPVAEVADCRSSPAVLLNALQTAKRTGLLILRGLEDDATVGEAFADLIGFKRKTNFGVMFEVLSKPAPNNLAYTALALPLHTDLPNQESVPGYQFLHCYRNSAAGGASVFADGFRICEDLRREEPELFERLQRQSVPWRFHDEDCDIRRHHPVIALDAKGNLERFVFNAHIADVPDLAAKDLYDFYAAYRSLMVRVRDPRYAVHHLLAPGEMAIFDNQRVLHGRTAFDPASGERHLRGYYIEHNEMDSRMRVLARALTKTQA